MAESCSNKRRKLLEDPNELTTATAPSTVNKIDRISILPDSLLCHILSFLPTTTSVVATTSLLSRRWRNLWKDLQAFHFTQYSFTNDNGESQYYCTANTPLFTSVERFLSLRTTRGFRKFHLECAIEEKELGTVQSWLNAAIGSNLEELQLNLLVEGKQNLVMPLTIFSCTKLVTLNLRTFSFSDSVTVLDQVSSFHLPSLKTLSFLLKSSNNLEALLSGCPVLETLNLSIIHICPNPNPKNQPTAEAIRVVSSSLKKLTINTSYRGVIIEELEIDSPCLEHLCLSIYGELDKLSARNLQKVETADLNFSGADGGYSLMDVLKQIYNASDLSLAPSAMDLLSLATCDLMDFNHLLRLQLTLQYFESEVVMDMLGKCHVLKDLTISRRHQVGESQEWTEPEEVPNCFVSHLERVTFFMYHDWEEEKEFITYILKQGLILKSVKIWADPIGFDVDSTDEEELYLIPTGSKMCQLEIIIIISS